MMKKIKLPALYMQKHLCPITKHAQSTPNHLALESDSLSLSYKNLDLLICNAQKFLFDNIPASASKIGIIADLTLETIVFYFAAIRSSLGCCLISPKEPIEVLQNKLKELDLNFFFISSENSSSNQNSFLKTFPSLSRDKTVKRINDFIEESQITTYLYTSGSSSYPKIACLTFGNHYYSALGIIEHLQLSCESRYLLNLPLYHVSGLSVVFRIFLCGGICIVKKPTHSLSVFLKENKVSHLSLVSTQYLRLLKEPLPLIYPELKAILLGGSHFSILILKEGLEKHLPLYYSYGLTEMSSTVTSKKMVFEKELASTGSPLPFRDLSIEMDGEITVSGQTLFAGYYSTTTHETIPLTTPFKTKDLGFFNEKNELILRGRKDRMVITGGENIQPEEIESHLKNIPGVLEAHILFLEEEFFGYKIVAIVESLLFLNLETIELNIKNLLPNYKRPKYYLEWPSDLRSDSSKLSHITKKRLYHYAFSKINNNS